MNTIRALVWKECRVLIRDKRFLVFLFAVPLLLAVILGPAIGTTPGAGGERTFAAIGFTVMFGFYIITYMGVSHYRDHGWGFWTMIRATGPNRAALAFGIAIPYLVLGCLQMVAMLTIGVAFLGVSIKGSYLALGTLILTTEAVIIGIGLILLRLTRSQTHMQQLSHLIVLILGAIGGALLPITAMDGWVQTLARATPQFWALRGLRGVVTEGWGIADVVSTLIVLATMAATFIAIGIALFDPRSARTVPLQ